jgi:hypothetical protein
MRSRLRGPRHCGVYQCSLGAQRALRLFFTDVSQCTVRSHNAGESWVSSTSTHRSPVASGGAMCLNQSCAPRRLTPSRDAVELQETETYDNLHNTRTDPRAVTRRDVLVLGVILDLCCARTTTYTSVNPSFACTRALQGKLFPFAARFTMAKRRNTRFDVLIALRKSASCMHHQ